MSRKIVNILMLLLAILYTTFVVAQLVLTLRSNDCEYRMPILLAIGLGVAGGVWLMASITRHMIKKSEFGHKLSRRLRRLFSTKKVKKG